MPSYRRGSDVLGAMVITPWNTLEVGLSSAGYYILRYDT